MKGKFIVFDGPDGCGKTTQSKMFYEYLTTEKEKKVKRIFFPGGCVNFGHLVRRLIIDKQVNDTEGAYLLGLERMMAYNEVIIHTLEKGTYIVSDRYNSSSYALQGKEITEKIDKLLQIPSADIYVIFRISKELAYRRCLSRGKLNAFEIAIFDGLFDEQNERYTSFHEYCENTIYIDVEEDETPEQIHEKVKKELSDRFNL